MNFTGGGSYLRVRDVFATEETFNEKGVSKNRDFRPISCFISETVLDI